LNALMCGVDDGYGARQYVDDAVGAVLTAEDYDARAYEAYTLTAAWTWAG